MMNKRLIGFLGAGCILAGLPCAASARLLSVQVAHVPKFTKLAQDMGPANPLQVLTLAVHLRYPDERAVQRFVDKVTDPRSPTFGAFLTPGQFTKSFDPTGHTYSTVEYVLTGAGGSLLETFVNNKILVIGMPVVIADVLFGTSIDQYSFGGTTYYANKTPAYLPSLLKGLVRSVNGFTDYSTRGANPAWPLGAPGIGPVQIETAYDEPIAVNPHMNGSGTTIAIATAGDYFDSDVAGYWSTYGVTRTGSLTRIPVSGSQGLRRRGMPHAALLGPETTLDVEQTTSNAPGANVEVYEGSDTLGTTFAAVYADIVDDPNVDVVTTSFGACEIGADESELLSDNDLFEQGAAEGQTWFAASGDNGSHDCGTNSPPFGYPGEPNPNSVDFPASSPYVTAAGGTTLGLNPSGGIASERAWSGSGGGVSRYFDRPAYQDPVPEFGRPQGAQRPGRRPRRGPRHSVRLLLRGFVATNGRRNERRRAQPRGPLRADRSGTRLSRGPRSERALSRLRQRDLSGRRSLARHHEGRERPLPRRKRVRRRDRPRLARRLSTAVADAGAARRRRVCRFVLRL